MPDQIKDLRDWLLAGGTFAGLQSLADAAPVEVAASGATGQSGTGAVTPNEAVDDPHRLARLFTASYYLLSESTLAYYRGEFLRWRDNAWRPFPLAEIRSELSRVIKAEFDRANIEEQLHPTNPDEPPPKCRKVTRTLVENVIGALQSLVIVPFGVEMPCWLTPRPDLPPASSILATQSGLLDLRTVGTGQDSLIPATPTFFSSIALDYGFDPQARCEIWERLMDSIWPHDRQSIEALQEYFGYCLTDDTRHHKLLMLIGPPRSGKGTLGRILTRMLSAANVAAPTLGSLADQFGLASLVGKRLALIADARLSNRADGVAVVERLLSIVGEDFQDVQRKHQSTLAGIRLAIKFLILANELPSLRDTAGALLARTLMLRTTRSHTGREDRGLEAKLVAELPGILNWAIAGWRRLQERGEFVQPETSRELLEDLEDLASPVGQFIREKCVTGPEWTVGVSDLFRVWCDWCKDHGRDHPGTEQTFGRDIRATTHQVTTRRTNRGGQRERQYVGIGIRGDGPQWSADFSIACVGQEKTLIEGNEPESKESRGCNGLDRGPLRTIDLLGGSLARPDMPSRPPWLSDPCPAGGRTAQ